MRWQQNKTRKIEQISETSFYLFGFLRRVIRMTPFWAKISHAIQMQNIIELPK